MQQQAMTDIAVIGGGIIGLCVAERLAHEGHSVILLEREEIAAGASARNAAGFAFSEIMPMASAATIRKAIKWLVDPTGPFSVVPQDLPDTIGWLSKFLFAARRSTYQRSLRTLAAMVQLEQKTLPEVIARARLESMVRESGGLYLYESMSQLNRDLKYWKLRQRHGVFFEIHEGDALHRFQPGLAKHIVAGVHAPKYKCVTDPRDYCSALHHFIGANNVVTRYETVNKLRPGENSVGLDLRDGSSIEARKVVLAAGPWSADLALQLDDKIPLVGERGYNTTLPKSAFPELSRTLFFNSHGFVIAPLQDGVRVGGASEIAKLDRRANFKRSCAMLKKARFLVPALDTENGEEWMGIRPTTPDTLPVVGRASRSPHVIYAFGHGHLGLTLASSTAKLVAELVSDRPTSIDIESLSPRRF